VGATLTFSLKYWYFFTKFKLEFTIISRKTIKENSPLVKEKIAILPLLLYKKKNYAEFRKF